MLTRRRLRAHAGLAVSIAAVIVLLAAVLSGMLASVAQAAVAGARQTLAAANGPDGGVRVGIRLPPDAARAAEQDAAVRAAIEQQLGGAGQSLVSIARDVVITEVPLIVDGIATEVGIVADPSRTAVDPPAVGRWPDAGAQIVVPAQLAASLGLGLDDVVALPASDGGTIEFVISGIVAEPARVADGSSPDAAGRPSGTARFPALPGGAPPLVVDDASLGLIDARPIARWTVAPDLDGLPAAGVDTIASGLPALADVIEEDPDAQSQGVIVEGGLAGTLDGIRAQSAVAGAILPVALALVAAAGVLATLELARSLAAARLEEVALLRSRGASGRQLIRAAALDWSLIAVPSVAVGAVAGVTAVRVPTATEGGVAGVEALVLGLLVALGVALAVIVTGTATAMRSARAPLQRESLGSVRRERRGVDAALLVLVVALAGIALVAFRLAGGPVGRAPGGGVAVDPLAVLAPALVLLAIALVGGAALPSVFGAIARWAQRRRGAGAAVATVQLARRFAAFAVPVLLSAIAVGSGVVAASYDATAANARADARALALGADVRVSAIDDGTAAQVIAGLRALEASSAGADPGGVVAGTPVVTAALSIAETTVPLIALDAASIDAVVADAGGTVEPETLRAALDAPAAPAIDVPPAATELLLEVRVEPAMPVDTAIWLLDAQGAAVRIAASPGATGSDAGDGAPSATSAVRVPLPSAAAGPDPQASWRLVAIDVRPTPERLPEDGVITVAVDSVSAAGGPTAVDASPLVPEAPWAPRPAATRGFPGEITAPESGATSGGEPLAAVRIVATRPPDQPVRLMAEASIPPIAITPALAERTALRTGDELRARTDPIGRPVVGVVAGTIAAVPGSLAEQAIAVDLGALTHHQLATTTAPLAADQYWLALGVDAGSGAEADAMAATDLEGLIAEAQGVAGGDATVEAIPLPPAAPLIEAVRVALWAAAAGIGVLALASIAAAAAADRRERAAEVVVLRALGRPAGLQGRDRAGEQSAILLGSALIGAAAGAAAAVMTVPELARAVVLEAPAALRVGLAQPAGVGAIGALVVVTAVGMLAVLHGFAVRRQARRLATAEVLR